MSLLYYINNSAGQNVATMDPATTSGSTFPISLFGYGWSPYGPILLQNDYHNMENFASTTHPINPVTGMWNYSITEKKMYFYDSVNWQQVNTANNSISSGFVMDATANNIDLTRSGSTVLFSYPNDGKTYHPVSVMFIPTVAPTAVLPVTFNLSIAAANDVMESSSITNVGINTHVNFTIDGTTKFLSMPGDKLSINVTAPTNNILKMKVLIFGLIS